MLVVIDDDDDYGRRWNYVYVQYVEDGLPVTRVSSCVGNILLSTLLFSLISLPSSHHVYEESQVFFFYEMKQGHLGLLQPAVSVCVLLERPSGGLVIL